MDRNRYDETDNSPMTAADPAAMLSETMRQAVHNAERDYEDGKCLSEEQFQQRFAKWL
ncbi:MAG: hypothetical protein IJ069_01820 [Prevotella sp.]|nr:hypothetical protein [Prevotella sp.]